MFKRKFLFKTCVLCYNFALVVCYTALAPPRGLPSEAVAIVRGSGNVSGRITFRQNVPVQRTFITGEIIGLTPGLHGFHVHQLGNLTAGCLSTGPHYNPFKFNHSSHDALTRHAGDFGNILADQHGIASINITDNVISLSGPTSVVGRSVVVHEREDDLGKGRGKSKAESLKTGNAGPRIACGVIGIAEEVVPPF